MEGKCELSLVVTFFVERNGASQISQEASSTALR